MLAIGQFRGGELCSLHLRLEGSMLVHSVALVSTLVSFCQHTGQPVSGREWTDLCKHAGQLC